ncbi:hypothetical protein ACLESO_53175 [Pyxidicoccus sp. 3LG]
MVAKHAKQKEYVYLFIQPDDINVLEDFTTELTVMGVPRDNPNEPENVTRHVELKVARVPVGASPDERARVKILRRNKGDTAFQVKGVKANSDPAVLVARPLKNGPLPANLVADAKVWVDESDLLVYAPDGRVYWLPTKTWRKAQSFDPSHPDNHTTPAIKDLSKVLLPLLKNETVVANIPHGADKPARPSAGLELPGAGAEPVTCFLLNLNSILMSYSPSKTLPPGHQDPSPNRPGAPRAPSGRKR